MNEDEFMAMISGADTVKTFANDIIAGSTDSDACTNDNISRYIKQKVTNHVYLRKDITDYDVDTYSNADRDNKMPSGSIARIASKMHKLSEEAYKVILRDAEDRNISILDVILEKARDRIIQPDVLDELEQKAVEDKFSKIPKLDIK